SRWMRLRKHTIIAATLDSIPCMSRLRSRPRKRHTQTHLQTSCAGYPRIRRCQEMANYPSRAQLSRTIAKAYFDERTERGAFATGSDRAADEVLRLITSLNGPKDSTGSHLEAVEAAARMMAGEHRGYSFYEHPFSEADREHHRSEA